MFQTKPVQSREEGLQNLLKAYAVCKQGWVLGQDSIFLADGREVPLLPWRTHYHTLAMLQFTQGSRIQADASNGAAAAHSTALSHPCYIRVQYTGCASEDLRKILWREIDITEFLLGEHFSSFYAVQNDYALYITAELNRKILCTMTLHASLPEGTTPIYRHELITRSGYVTDRSVDTELTPESMYLLNEGGIESYNAVDALTYGLDQRDVADVRAALAILSGRVEAQSYIETGKHLDRMCDLVYRAARTGMRLEVEEERI